MQLAFGPGGRLRGDAQPEGSDAYENRSPEYEGPRFWPVRIGAASARVLSQDNVREITPDHLRTNLKDPRNVGREIPLDVLRPRLGSRGDVACHARFHEGAGYILEISRLLRTGHDDDLALDADPFVPYLFAVALHDGTDGARHAVSGPLELRFVTEE
jgi:hypothetical protein